MRSAADCWWVLHQADLMFVKGVWVSKGAAWHAAAAMESNVLMHVGGSGLGVMGCCAGCSLQATCCLMFEGYHHGTHVPARPYMVTRYMLREQHTMLYLTCNLVSERARYICSVLGNQPNKGGHGRACKAG